jgi:tetratricopeptide (TPR) repeat protein
MKHRFSVGIVIVLLAIFSLAATATSDTGNLFTRANEAMGKGEYTTATELYEKLIQKSGYSADVLFNLAVSYEHSGQPGKAILNYERALRLSPTDSDIKGNLHLLRKKNGLYSREFSWSEKFFQLLNMDQWLLSGLVFLVIFSLLQLAVALQFPLSIVLKRTVSITCLFLITLSVAGALYRYPVYHAWVVTAEGSRLLLSPFDSSRSNGSIQAGRLVFPEKKHHEFTYIKDDTGRTGWIRSRDIEPIVPQVP